MKLEKILIVLIVSSLLVGCVCATSITDFKVDGAYKEIYSTDDLIVYADSHNDAGLGIYKITDKHEDDNYDDDDAIDDLIHDDGDEYITADDDMKLTTNPDKTANFTDADHGTLGVSEVVDHNGQKHVIVFWAKNSSHKDLKQLKTDIDSFNKNNNLTPIAF